MLEEALPLRHRGAFLHSGAARTDREQRMCIGAAAPTRKTKAEGGWGFVGVHC